MNSSQNLKNDKPVGWQRILPVNITGIVGLISLAHWLERATIPSIVCGGYYG
jgi:hypothetical protein